VRSLLVVLVDELVEQGLEFSEGRCRWVSGEPALEGLVEAFDFATGGRVVRSAVLLGDAECVEQALVAVAATAAAGQPGGEDHPVVGQRGGWHTVGLQGVCEGVDDDRAGDAPVGGDGDRVAGVVIDPAQDLDVGAVSETPVGEVGLPHLVGHLGLEADVGRAWTLLRLGRYAAAASHEAVDRRT
jgi:hypothetical protein